jgi:tRNA G18 (ribose-2'-O)-methylase SpoU
MLIRCPYPDCLFDYELADLQTEPPSLKIALCPKCQKQGTAISTEMQIMFQERSMKAQEFQTSDIKTVKKNTFLVLIDNVRSSWNVGSIFRTSDAAEVSFLYLCGITGCPPNNQISKTALGAEQTVPWQYYAHPLEIIPKLKTQGIVLIGLERSKKSANLTDVLKSGKVSKPLCLVVGNENNGLSPETMHYCDYICSLPMKGMKESLNAAVAFGIAAYMINEFATTRDAENVFRQ